jgi:hypothetical protein
MSRTNRILSVLLLIQVGVAVAMALTRDTGGIARSELVFPDLTTSQVSRIEIHGAKGGSTAGEATQAVLEKDGATWRVSGSGYPADAKKVDEFLGQLTKLRARGPVVTSAKHHRTLEVADEVHERRVTLTSGDKPLGFYLGKAAGPQATHLRKDGDSQVLRVEGIDVWSVGDRPAQWIDPSYVKVDSSELWSVTVEGRKGTYRLEKGETGEWRLADLGKNEEMDKATADDLVRTASTLNLDEPVGRTVAPEHGLQAPAVKVTLATGKPGEGGKRPAQTKDISFAVGSRIEPSARYYVKSSESEFVVQASEYAVKSLLEKGRRDLVKAK